MTKDIYKGDYLILRRGRVCGACGEGILARPTTKGVNFAEELVTDDVKDVDRVMDDTALDQMFIEGLEGVVGSVENDARFPRVWVDGQLYESEARDPVAYWALGHTVRWRRVETEPTTPPAKAPGPVSARNEWRRAKFQLEGVEGGPWEGWTDGTDWNGFACPAFPNDVLPSIDEAILAAGYEASYQMSRIPVPGGPRYVARYTSVLTWSEVQSEV